ncbi:Ig-like domain-containing protein [Thermococcus henrietii]|uniref:Ig-like domain-containing protein n=1 Tax=Thermococcus henrietii TaxID=2016361 RepID=UPI000C0834A4|nr:Ig-like domain-containing protein [Thermococcus henrietii]
MRFKLCALLIVMLLLVHIPAVSSEGSSLLSVTVLNDTIPALPGSTIVVPFSITNLGNETINNVTVYVTGPAQGFQYSVKVIRTPIEPGKSVNDTITVKVLNTEPGPYLLTLVARVGSVYASSKFVVRVRSVIDYTPSIVTDRKYVYGHGVNVTLRVYSTSNTVITGKIGYVIERNGVPLVNETLITFVRPDSFWIKRLSWKTLPVGNYTVLLWANLSGVYKSATASFEVYQRNLHYRVYFWDGAIHVRVYNSTGGVPGIPVEINGLKFTTGPDGTFTYAVPSPGLYNVVLNLDGRIAVVPVTVEKLSISTAQSGNVLTVRVTANNTPVPNVTVTVLGPASTAYGVTNASGEAVFNLTDIGYGTIVVRAQSDRYLPSETVIAVSRPSQTTTSNPSPTRTSSTTSTPSNTTFPVPTETSKATSTSPSHVGIILILAGLILAGTSYLAFAVPVIHEETLDRYYFLKVRAPKLRPLKNYRVERAVNAVEVRVTRGNAKLENGKLVWELDLEPGEEAYLQAVLG